MVRTCSVTVLLLALAAPASAAPAPTALTGGDPCTLIEGLPSASAPIRKAKAVKGAFRALDKAVKKPARFGDAHAQLAKAVAKALAESEGVFHPGVPFREWKKKHRDKAQKFMTKYVMGREPILRVGVVGFEPVPALRAAMMWAACRAGETEAAIRYGRRATAEDEGPARGFAALLLLATGRSEEAAELGPRVSGHGCLAAFVAAALTSDADERRRRLGDASRRVSTPAQQTAVETLRSAKGSEAP